MCGQSVAISSSNSRSDGEPPKNVTILSPGGRTTLGTSLLDIDIDVPYNVTMIAENEIGASQPSNSVLFIRQPGMYVCTVLHYVTTELKLVVIMQQCVITYDQRF